MAHIHIYHADTLNAVTTLHSDDVYNVNDVLTVGSTTYVVTYSIQLNDGNVIYVSEDGSTTDYTDTEVTNMPDTTSVCSLSRNELASLVNHLQTLIEVQSHVTNVSVPEFSTVSSVIDWLHTQGVTDDALTAMVNNQFDVALQVIEADLAAVPNL
jgi:hypothetical protein